MSHAVVDPDRDQLIQCPYDPVHMISQMRFPYHLIKCRKNHNGREYKICPFDAKHVIPGREFEDHVRECDKRSIIEPQLVLDDDRGEGLQIPESKSKAIEELLCDDWDAEAPTPARRKAMRPPTQTCHNTFNNIDTSSGPMSIGQTSSFNDNYNHQKSFGRGRAKSYNGSSFVNVQMGPVSYKLENTDSHNPPTPSPSFGRGRGQFEGIGKLRKPNQNSYKTVPTTKESLEKSRLKLHKKFRQIKALEVARDSGERLEQTQLDKIASLNHIQAELLRVSKQIDSLPFNQQG